MSTLINDFEERLAEVETYLDFLSIMEAQTQHGPPRLQGAEHPISTQQHRMLYSSVYLQLYNLVESTMSKCIEAVAKAVRESSQWKPSDLSPSLRRQWVRMIARTHDELNSDNRLNSAWALCEHLVTSLPVAEFVIDKCSGNWDDQAIEETLSKRLDLQLVVTQPVYGAIKRKVRDEFGPLGLVKDFRNKLAHGDISFVQCAEDINVAQLIDLKDKTANYLREVVDHFDQYINTFEYLLPERRPA